MWLVGGVNKVRFSLSNNVGEIYSFRQPYSMIYIPRQTRRKKKSVRMNYDFSFRCDISQLYTSSIIHIRKYVD